MPGLVTGQRHPGALGRRKISQSCLHGIVDQPKVLAPELAELKVISIVIVDPVHLRGSTSDVKVAMGR
jgi:hypothetical protein